MLSVFFRCYVLSVTTSNTFVRMQNRFFNNHFDVLVQRKHLHILLKFFSFFKWALLLLNGVVVCLAFFLKTVIESKLTEWLFFGHVNEIEWMWTVSMILYRANWMEALRSAIKCWLCDIDGFAERVLLFLILSFFFVLLGARDFDAFEPWTIATSRKQNWRARSYRSICIYATLHFDFLRQIIGFCC